MKNLLTLLLGLLVLPSWGAVKFEDLSPQEQLGQTLVAFVDVDSAELVRPAIEQGKLGGVLIQWGNYSFKETRRLVDKLQGWAAKSPHKIPLLVSIDYEGGTVYTPITLGFDYLPTNMLLAASQDEEKAAALAYLAGQQLRRAGVHINFSPVLDVNSNPRNPIIGVRSFGSDPQTVTKMGMALISGFKAAGILPIVKHFPGHGDTAIDSHYSVPVVNANKAELKRTHLVPFAAAIKQGVPGIMTGHVMYPALDSKNVASFSKPILQDLLRQEMGFKGLIVTDSLDMKSATHFCTIAGCAVRSLQAGADMVLLGRYIKPLTLFDQINTKVQEQNARPRVAQAARRIFDLKKQLGLLGNTPRTVPAPIERAYQQTLAELSQEAVTLVRDNDGLLPFSSPKERPTVCAVFFSPARFADQLMHVSKPFLERNYRVRTYNAPLIPKEKDMTRALKCADGADLVVAASLQWADKVNLSQKRTIEKLKEKAPNLVLLSVMSPYDIPHYPGIGTVLATYGLNAFALQTAADIIVGNAQAQGVMPVQLPDQAQRPTAMAPRPVGN